MNLNPQPTDRRPLRVEVSPDRKLILILDGAGELLALTPAEAAGLVEDMSSLFDVIGWPS